MGRQSRMDYDEPGSFGRVLEAGISIADADSDDDREYHAAEMRLRQAVSAHAPRVLGARGGRARAAALTPERRREIARLANAARQAKRAAKQET